MTGYPLVVKKNVPSTDSHVQLLTLSFLFEEYLDIFVWFRAVVPNINLIFKGGHEISPHGETIRILGMIRLGMVGVLCSATSSLPHARRLNLSMDRSNMEYANT